MKTYISGPIAGSPDLPREEKLTRFGRAAEVLQQDGRETLNPLDLAACDVPDCGDQNGHTWDCWLRYDLIGMLQECDSIAMLPDWFLSKGAKLELHIAEQMGWEVIDLTDNIYILGVDTLLNEDA